MAQRILHFDRGERYYRLHPEAIEAHNHLIQHDDEVAEIVFKLYAEMMYRHGFDRGEILHRGAVLFLERYRRNLLRLVDGSDRLDEWRKVVD